MARIDKSQQQRTRWSPYRLRTYDSDEHAQTASVQVAAHQPVTSAVGESNDEPSASDLDAVANSILSNAGRIATAMANSIHDQKEMTSAIGNMFDLTSREDPAVSKAPVSNVLTPTPVATQPMPTALRSQLLVNHRPAQKLRIERLVQQSTRIMMRRTTTKDPLPDGPRDDELHPTPSDLRPAWDEPMGSRWNEEVINLVVNFVFEGYATLLQDSDRPLVEHCCQTHMRYLRDEYHLNLVMDDEARQNRRKAKRRTQIKREKLNRRMDAMVHPSHPRLKRHLAVFNSMGVAGMSSEEEVSGPAGSRFWVRYPKAFLSLKMHRLKDHLDKIFFCEIRGTGIPFLYQRAGSGKMIPGLPKNVYLDAWFSSLSQAQKKKLCFLDIAHEFADDEV